MRSRAPLALMEQLVMLLVFALAAALCVQGLTLADRMSAQNAARDRALLEAQNAAEALKAGRVQTFAREEEALLLWYDAEWAPCGPDQAVYRLEVRPQDSGHPLLWSALVQVEDGQGRALAQLPVAGQRKEAPYGG